MKCYRYTAITGQWQSFMSFEETYTEKKKKCKDFRSNRYYFDRIKLWNKQREEWMASVQKISIKEFMTVKFSGQETSDRCEQCGSKIIKSENGKWCSNDDCTWSDNDFFEHFLNQQKKKKK